MHAWLYIILCSTDIHDMVKTMMEEMVIRVHRWGGRNLHSPLQAKCCKSRLTIGTSGHLTVRVL